VLDEALDAKAKGEKRVILFNLSGHGNFDMGAYEAYLGGKLEDCEYPAEEVRLATLDLPKVDVPV
jgi:tryptophan synthase beta chain